MRQANSDAKVQNKDRNYILRVDHLDYSNSAANDWQDESKSRAPDERRYCCWKICCNRLQLEQESRKLIFSDLGLLPLEITYRHQRKLNDDSIIETMKTDKKLHSKEHNGATYL
jgi:hypothetical protein